MLVPCLFTFRVMIICPIYRLHYQICKSLVWYGMYSLYQQKSMSTWIFNMIFLCIVCINKFMEVSVFYMSVNHFMFYVFAILPSCLVYINKFMLVPCLFTFRVMIICPIYRLHYQICKSLVWYGMYSLYQQKSMSTWIFNMIFLCIVCINKFMEVSVFYMSVNLFMSYVFAILPRIWL